MAFDGKKLGLHPSQGGQGGFVTYYQEEDSTATILGPAYWPAPSDIADAEDAKAMQAVIDFIERQADKPTGRGVIFLVVGSNAGSTRRLRLATVAGKTVVRPTTTA